MFQFLEMDEAGISSEMAATCDPMLLCELRQAQYGDSAELLEEARRQQSLARSAERWVQRAGD